MNLIAKTTNYLFRVIKKYSLLRFFNYAGGLIDELNELKPHQ